MIARFLIGPMGRDIYDYHGKDKNTQSDDNLVEGYFLFLFFSETVSWSTLVFLIQRILIEVLSLGDRI